MNAPLQTAAVDYTRHVSADAGGICRLRLIVEGMHCAGCAFKIEKALRAEGVEARINVTEKRLSLAWQGAPADGGAILAKAEALGFRFLPVEKQQSEETAQLRYLTRCIAVAGFTVGNLMAFSLALWFTPPESMGAPTRIMMHWYSALITLPTVIYAGGPFFRSAWQAVSRGRTNMDVPISVALVLASVVSLHEAMAGADHVYFDSVAMLLFLLLIGRYLDARMRARARGAASDLLKMMQGTAHVAEDGGTRRVPAEDLAPGMRLHLAKGERLLADGTAEEEAVMDASALTGETLPQIVPAGGALKAGMVNLGQPLHVRIEKTQNDSLIGDIITLMQKAEQGGARYVQIADRVARWYTPVVHALALLTFIGWMWTGAAWQTALLTAITVLIITCPCALGLAVPVAQVMAGSWLFRRGMFLKSADALERLEKVDTVIFDKTGTLTTGQIVFENAQAVDENTLRAASALAGASRHPLARALAAAVPVKAAEGAHEKEGRGMEIVLPDGRWQRLGSARFLGVSENAEDEKMELWFGEAGSAPVRLVFSDLLHKDAAATVARIKKTCRVVLLSGDRPEVVRAIAEKAGIDTWRGGVDPREKYEWIDMAAAAGHHVLMVGDGLNDAAALSRADVSMSPSSALDIAQNAADIVYQKPGVGSVADALDLARRTQSVVRESFGLAIVYNVIAVPLAVLGFVTPLVAAVSMSLSSLLVVGNALRLRKGGR